MGLAGFPPLLGAPAPPGGGAQRRSRAVTVAAKPHSPKTGDVDEAQGCQSSIPTAVKPVQNPNRHLEYYLLEAESGETCPF